MRVIEKFMEVQFEQAFEQGLENLVDYLRGIQELYENDEANESGIMCLNTMLEQGTINLQLYTSIKPAVEDYRSPYTLTIIKP